MSQWSQGDRSIWQAEAWLRSPPTFFAKPESVRLLTIWNVKVENQGSGVSGRWRNYDCCSEGIGRAGLRRHAFRLCQLDWTTWLSHWAWWRILHKVTWKDRLSLYHMAR
jgi:hypothetical protein